MDLAEVEAVKEKIRATPTEMATAEMAEHGGEPLRFGLGTGLTEEEDEYRVAVRLTTPEQEQRFRERFAQLIEEHADDIDIKVVGEGSLLQSAVARETECDPETPPATSVPLSLQIGSGVRHVNGRSGTLAFFARLDGKMGLVSCNHVLARRDRAEEGDAIVAADTGERVGCLRVIEELGGERPPRADCAFAVLCDQRRAPKSPGRSGRFQLESGAPAVTKYVPVYKIGAESDVTEGRISVVNVEWEIDYGRFFAKFTDLIEIESIQQDREGLYTPLAVDGDSGALVVTKQGNFPIGVLFYKTPGGPGNSGMVYANPLTAIETALGVTMAF